MTRTRVIFIGSAGEPRWLLIDDGRIFRRGVGAPDIDATERTVAVVPSPDVAIRWASFTARSQAQAVAIARTIVTDDLLPGQSTTHVAVAVGDEAAGVTIATVNVASMQRWLVDLAAIGIDPDAIVPAQLMIPAPKDGFVRADLDGDVIVRGARSAFAHDEAMTPLITGGIEPTPIDQLHLDAAIIAAAAQPPFDLRQGMFARRSPRMRFDRDQWRQLALLTAAVVLLAFIAVLVGIARDAVGAAMLNARADRAIQASLGTDANGADADRMLADRLAALQGPGAGFSTTTAAVLSAFAAVPGTAATAMTFGSDGTMRVGVAARDQASIDQLRQEIARQGFSVTLPGTANRTGDQLRADLQLAPLEAAPR